MSEANPDEPLPNVSDTVLHESHRTLLEPPRVWTVLLVTLAALVLSIVNGLVAIPVIFLAEYLTGGKQYGLHDLPTMMTESRFALVVMITASQTAFLLPATFAAFLSPVGFRRRLNFARGSWPLWAWGAAALGTPLVGLVSTISLGFFVDESETIKEMSEMFRIHGKNGFLIPLAVMIGGFPAICEECLFRGYMQTRLVKRWGVGTGVLISSVCFAVAHLDPVHVLAVFPIGLWLGYVTVRCGSIFPAMIAHFFNNAFAVVVTVLQPGETPDTLASEIGVIAIGILGLGLIGVAGTIVASRRFPPTPDSVALSLPRE